VSAAGHDLTCQELVELVSDYLEGALSPVERARFEQHISRCDGCATYLDQMKRTIALVGTLTEETVDPPARDTLLRAFRDWHGANR
jgi:anti-sigma factor RsiW